MKIIIFRNDEIGDFLCWLPAARFLRRQYPAAHITIVVKPQLTRLAENFPYFDRIVAFRRYDCLRQWLWPSIRFFFKIAGRYDLVINPVLDVRTNEFSFGIFGARQKYHIAMPHLLPKSYEQQWINRLIPFFNRELRIEHNQFIGEINQQLLSMVTGGEVRVDAAGILDQFRTVPNHLTVLGIGGRDPRRRWPTANWQTLAAELLRHDNGVTIALIGDPNDRETGEIIRGNHDRIINCCGKTTLTEMLGIVCNADRVITNETVIAHAGALGGVRTTVIAGGGHWGIFVPYPAPFSHVTTVSQSKPCFGCNWRCFEQSGSAYPCIREISLQTVLSAVFPGTEPC